MSESSELNNTSSDITDYLRSKTEEMFIESLQNEFNIHLAPNSRRNLQDLYHDLQIGETWFDIDPHTGELTRHTEVANIDIFYLSSDGKTFILKEDERITLPKGSTPQGYFKSKVTPIRVQLVRKTNHSISERMKTSTEDQEKPVEAAIRGVSEEIFENSNKNFILENIKFNGNTVATRSKDDKDNSYSGLKVTYHNHNFTLIIPEPDKPFFEFDSAKGYLNTFVWEEIPAVEQITFRDENNIEQTRIITSENSPDILREVMICEQKKDKYDYELRTKIIRISNGKIETYQAFTKDPAILDDEYRKRQNLGDYLADSNNWLTERSELHNRIIEDEFAKVQILSGILSEPTPTIFMLRGNNGSGKSTLLKTHERFKKARSTNFEGVINTDTYDAVLRRESMATALQVHEEGIVIEKEIRRRALEQSDLSIIFDKRFSYQKQIDDILKASGNRNIEIFDLDVPLEVSAIRVLLRNRDEDAPIVRFNTLAQGFSGIRNLRNYLTQIVEENSRINYYLLLDTSYIPPIEIASKESGQKLIESRDPDQFEILRKKVTEEEAIEIGNSLITQDIILNLLKSFQPEVRFEMNSRLIKYMDKTLFEALEQASKSL